MTYYKNNIYEISPVEVAIDTFENFPTAEQTIDVIQSLNILLSDLKKCQTNSIHFLENILIILKRKEKAENTDIEEETL